MNRRKSKAIKIIVALTAICMCFNSCAKKAEDVSDVSSGNYGDSYPIQTTESLTIWDGSSTVYGVFPDAENMPPYYEGLKELTGVDAEFQFPAAGQANENFNLLIASDKLPDIIQYNWLSVSGGPEKYLDEGYIVPLNDLYEKYSPNLTAYLAQNPEQDKMIKTDSNKYYCYPQLQGPDYLGIYVGPLVRKDWLKEDGLSAPETVDEWYEMLKSFKENHNSSGLIYLDNQLDFTNLFISAFGTAREFFIGAEGNVVYGPVQPGYKDFLQLFNKWYGEGLIFQDIATVDTKVLNKVIASEKTGSFIGTSGSMNSWIPTLKEANPKAELAGVKNPVLNKGDTPMWGQKDLAYKGLGGAAITSQCKNQELAARYLDFSYSEQGRMYKNFGLEGETYNIVDGYPKITDEIMGNFDEIFNYTNDYQTILDKRKFEQRMSRPEQQQAIEKWADTNVLKYKMPPITATTDENQELTNIMAEINTYMRESTYKFIFGNESLDNFDKYVQTIENMGLEKAVQMKQAGLNRYKNRK